MPRSLIDAKLITTKVLPAAAANNAHDGIDLGTITLGDVILEAKIDVEALPSLVDAKNATFTLQDSADGVNFLAIPALSSLTLTGAGGAGAAKATRYVYLPRTTRRYVRLYQAVDAAGGDSTAKKSTLTLLVVP
jgi:hypothetical protein